MSSLGIEEIRLLLTATFKIIDASKDKKESESYAAELKFLSLFIEEMLDRVLNDRTVKDKSKKEQFEYIKNNFLKFKVCIQMAVAHSFQTSMEKYANIPVEYYCLIKMAQENSKVSH
jgi:hypothetical protein